MLPCHIRPGPALVGMLLLIAVLALPRRFQVLVTRKYMQLGTALSDQDQKVSLRGIIYLPNPCLY
jgi:hypothetical protein